jgi:hypothetical protein
MKLQDLLQNKEIRKEHRSIAMFSEMDNLVSHVITVNDTVLTYGSDTNERGITECSYYREVNISGVVLTLKIYLQASGDRVYYHSCSILDDVLGLNIFSPDEYEKFTWLKESLLDEINSWLTYQIDYINTKTCDIEQEVLKNLISLYKFNVCEDEPCKY